MVRWHDVMSRIVRWVFVAGFVVPVVAFGAIAAICGFDHQDRFEVIIISIDWWVLIVNGILLALIFQRHRNAGTRT